MKRALIIVNTGTPDSPRPEDVRAYLKSFLSHPRIVPTNPLLWKVILNGFILRKRSVASSRKYETIWSGDGFKFPHDMKELADKLEGSYAASGDDVVVRYAMSFGKPSIESVMKSVREEGCERLSVLPLYPQNAFSQAFIVADQVKECASRTGWGGSYEIIGDYSDNETYLRAIADSIRAAGFDASDGDRIIMGFHSIPKVDIEHGDTYDVTTARTCEWLAKELGIPDEQWARGFMCRFDKKRTWLEPYSPEVIDKWWYECFEGRLFYVCPNFSIDCLETYYDVVGVLQVMWRGRMLARDVKPRKDLFVYVPCLGASDRHVDVVRDVVDNPSRFL